MRSRAGNADEHDGLLCVVRTGRTARHARSGLEPGLEWTLGITAGRWWNGEHPLPGAGRGWVTRRCVMAPDEAAGPAGPDAFGILGPLEVLRSGRAVPLGGPR